MKAKKTVYGKVYQDILRLDKLTLKGIAVYSMLTTYTNNEGKCWPSISTLTKDLPIGRRTIMRGIKELIDAEIISKETGKNNCNIYTLSSGTIPPPSSVRDAPLEDQVVSQMHHGSVTDAPPSSVTDAPKHLKSNITININSDFENFWNQYHLITNLAKTDRKAAEKHWKKLNQEDRKKAAENIRLFYDSLPDKNFCKKARTYLYDENFNDEFKNPQKTIPRPK